MTSPSLGQVSISWTRAKPLVIEGSGDASVLVGAYRDGASSGKPLFSLSTGNVAFRNFAVRNVPFFVSVPNGGAATNVLIQQLSIEDVHSGIVLNSYKKFTAEDWLIEGVRIVGYFEQGIRIAGPRTQRIAVRNALIDGGGLERLNDCFKSGITLRESVKDVTIEDVHIKNNFGCAEALYQQGDGIDADDKLGAPQRITLRRVVSSGNRDGAFDLKADDMLLEDLVADSAGVGRHGFRFWRRAYECLRCRVAGNTDIHLMNSQLVFRQPLPAIVAGMVRCDDWSSFASSSYRVEQEGQLSLETRCVAK